MTKNSIILKIGLRVSPSMRKGVLRIPVLGRILQNKFRKRLYVNSIENKYSVDSLYEVLDALEFRVSKIERVIRSSDKD
jgi:hypothetical protein